MAAAAEPTDAEVEALEAELERFKADAARQLDEVAALTDAAETCVADAKRELHDVRAPPAARAAARAALCRCTRPSGYGARARGAAPSRGAALVNAPR
jgi:hypothetical protein